MKTTNHIENVVLLVHIIYNSLKIMNARINVLNILLAQITYVSKVVIKMLNLLRKIYIIAKIIVKIISYKYKLTIKIIINALIIVNQIFFKKVKIFVQILAQQIFYKQ